MDQEKMQMGLDLSRAEGLLSGVLIAMQYDSYNKEGAMKVLTEAMELVKKSKEKILPFDQ